MKEIKSDTIKCLSNHVLLKTNVHNDKLKLTEDLTIWLDTSYSEGRHANINCKVVAVPDKLIFNSDFDEGVSMPHDTEQQLKVGDIVIAEFNAIYSANNIFFSTIEVEGEACIFIPYNQLIVAKRPWTKTEIDTFWKVNVTFSEEHIKELELENIIIEGEQIYTVIPLNGYTLVKPIEKEYETKLIVPDYLKKKKKMTLSQVVFAGIPNKRYWRNTYPPDCHVKNGQYVIMDKDCDLDLQPVEHRDFIGDRQFWYVALKNIVTSVDEIQEMLSAVGVSGEIKVKE